VLGIILGLAEGELLGHRYNGRVLENAVYYITHYQKG
jgi:hypothetical protein